MIFGTPPPVYPWPIGVGPRYHPTAANAAVRAGKPVDGMTCANGRRFAVHLELFADRKVIIVPPRIGIARSGCRYPLATDTPTGIVDVLARGRFTLGDLFRIWGRRLSAKRLLSFPGRVSVYVNGRKRTGDPGTLPLRRHDEIVVEVGPYVAPHTSYLFPKGAG